MQVATDGHTLQAQGLTTPLNPGSPEWESTPFAVRWRAALIVWLVSAILAVIALV